MRVYLALSFLLYTVLYVEGNSNGLLYHALEPDQDIHSWAEEGWQKLHRVEANQILEFTLALKQQNKAELESILLEVSDPDSQNYGEYLTVDQITEIVSPSEETIEIVRIWLANNDVPQEKCSLTANKDFLVCKISCEVAEKLLTGVVFSYFKHAKLKSVYVRSNSRYYVPVYVAQHLDFIGGVHRFPNVNFLKTKQVDFADEISEEGEGIHVGVYPTILRNRYNLTAADVGSHPNNSQAVAQFLEQYFTNRDLSEFMRLFVGSDFAHQTSINHVVGPNSGSTGIEASLDTQYIMSMGSNITTWFWSTAGRHASQEPFLLWLVELGNTSVIPPVFSVSYGDNEDSLSQTYMKRMSVEFQKLGLRGVSVLVSSGDDGAACKDNKFRPAFPVSSPYVTGVGGTGFSNPFSTGPEFGYEISGGGFSNVFPRPLYQAAQVASYMNTSQVPPQMYFNKTGRAYPDIASLCRHFWIVKNIIPAPGVMGTSASAPTVAGIMSMLNEYRLRSNKPTMGFLNPFLYKNPQALFDVTTGYNEGCQEHDRGFYAAKGYDPVTGNGTPNFPELLKAAMKMF